MSEINLCVVAGTHGNEFQLGSRVQQEIESIVPGEVYMLNGNPRATKACTRFVDSDLNRAFDGSGTGYEAERVEEIREIVSKEGFTHMIDIHTSVTTHSVVPIVPEECYSLRTEDLITPVQAIKDIVIIPQKGTPSSLVGNFGQGGIGLECPRYQDDVTSGIIAGGVVDLLKGRAVSRRLRNIFVVEGLIPKEVNLRRPFLDDFVEIPEIGGLSFVADSTTYRRLNYDHQGFIVRKKEERHV